MHLSAVKVLVDLGGVRFLLSCYCCLLLLKLLLAQHHVHPDASLRLGFTLLHQQIVAFADQLSQTGCLRKEIVTCSKSSLTSVRSLKALYCSKSTSFLRSYSSRSCFSSIFFVIYTRLFSAKFISSLLFGFWECFAGAFDALLSRCCGFEDASGAGFTGADYSFFPNTKVSLVLSPLSRRSISSKPFRLSSLINSSALTLDSLLYSTPTPLKLSLILFHFFLTSLTASSTMSEFATLMILSLGSMYY